MQNARTLTVVKFFQDGCRSCRALNPKYVAVAAELAKHGISFNEVNLQRARPIFTAEQIRVAPSVHIYHPRLGRISGLGFRGARTASSMRKALTLLVEPSYANALEELAPEAFSAPARFAAVVDALRAIAQAPRLLAEAASGAAGSGGSGRAPAAKASSDAAVPKEQRRGQIADIFAWLSTASVDASCGGASLLSIDDLVAATRALAAVEEAAGVARPAACFAPSRLIAAGLVVERAKLEAAVEGACAAVAPSDNAALLDHQPEAASAHRGRGLDLSTFVAVLAAHDAAQRTKPQASIDATFAALGGGLPIRSAAERLAAFDCAMPQRQCASAVATPVAIEAALDALDFERSGVAGGELLARLIIRAPQRL